MINAGAIMTAALLKVRQDFLSFFVFWGFFISYDLERKSEKKGKKCQGIDINYLYCKMGRNSWLVFSFSYSLSSFLLSFLYAFFLYSIFFFFFMIAFSFIFFSSSFLLRHVLNFSLHLHHFPIS